MNRPRPLFLGIAGGSGSGKSYLARRVQELAKPENAALVSMDQYFRTSDMSEGGDINFDHPNHIDLDLLTHHLQELRSGRAVKAPRYDFAERKQVLDDVLIEPVPVIIIEGLFVLSSPILDELDMTCFLDVSDDQRLLGRILRDLQERDSEIGLIIERYQWFVRPSYHVFVAPARQNADVVVDFTYRRALFTHLLAHIIRDYAVGSLDLPSLIEELKSESYALGYRADESIMPIAIDIRRLAAAYPESAFPAASAPNDREPNLFIAIEPS